MAACSLVRYLAALILLTLGGCQPKLPECGVAVTNTRILGGVAAAPGSWPWQVSVHALEAFLCGGSLISSDWVLTAAHCVGDPSVLTVYLGRHSQSGSNSQEESRGVQRTVCHPGYDILTIENDICLLQLSAPVSFKREIYPVCLAAAGSTFPSGTSSWVTGWGTTDNGELANILQEVQLQVVGNNECRCSYRELVDTMMCAGVREGGKDSCQGDSGGPLVTKHSNASIWVQSGIVSFGIGCGKPGVPGVYTRVSDYQDWISNVTGSSQPGFVPYASAGADSDEGFVCPRPLPPTTTAAPGPGPTNTTRLVTDCDKSIFGRAESAVPSPLSASVSVLCALLPGLRLLAGDS